MTNPTALAVVLDVLAVARLTALVLTDRISSRPREALIRRSISRQTRGQQRTPRSLGGFAYLLTCPWCTGLWIAAAVTTCRYLIPDVWSPVAYALALAAVAPVLTTRFGPS